MTKLVGSYSIRNLIQSTEFLLKITRSLNDEINNLEKLTGTETKLRVLRGRLTEFIEGGDEESLKATDASLSIELKQYESFLLTLTTTLNEKIASLEKIASRINAE